MKPSHILTTGACLLAFAGLASAVPTVITITGSSAYRGPVHTAIVKVLNGTVDTSGATPLASLPSNGGTGGFAVADSSNFTKGNGATFRGYIGGDSSKEVIIKTSWTGSAAGIQTVASTNASFTVRVLPAATTLATTGHFGLDDPTDASKAADTVVPDVAMADNKQSSTPFTGTFSGEPYTTLTATKVGVVAFQFVRAKGTPTTVANMTPQIAKALWSGTGKLPLSFFTGVGTDTTLVYATGRDPDSGTRIDTFAETGVGIDSVVVQYDCATEAPYIAQTVNGIDYDAGQGGEKSGGTLAKNGKMAKTGLAKYYVGYMSTGDAADLATNSGIAPATATLTYNGVAYTKTAVQQGQYTLWGNEYLAYKPSLATPAGNVKITFATTLRDQILNTDASILISSMKVQRNGDGETVVQ